MLYADSRFARYDEWLDQFDPASMIDDEYYDEDYAQDADDRADFDFGMKDCG